MIIFKDSSSSNGLTKILNSPIFDFRLIKEKLKFERKDMREESKNTVIESKIKIIMIVLLLLYFINKLLRVFRLDRQS